MILQFIARLYILFPIIASFGIGSSQLYGSIPCANTFISNTPTEYDVTSNFISYLSQLYEINTLTIEDLKIISRQLNSDPISLNITPLEADTDPVKVIQFDEINYYLSNYNLERKKILDWIDKIFKSTELQILHHHKSLQATKDSMFIPITFVPFIKTKDTWIEVSPYLVTQKQWVDVMHENPSFNIHGEGSMELNIDGKQVPIKPNHPVESITRWSALEFANRLSQLHGYTPHYDLSKIKWREGTRVENGALLPKLFITEEIKSTLLVHQEANTNGYRLISSGVKKILMRSSPLELIDTAWTHENSQGTTREIALLKPQKVSSEKFYDVFGNVSEWTDLQGFDIRSGYYIIFFEGSFNSNQNEVHCSTNLQHLGNLYFHRGSKEIGLRLMRDRSCELNGNGI